MPTTAFIPSSVGTAAACAPISSSSPFCPAASALCRPLGSSFASHDSRITRHVFSLWHSHTRRAILMWSSHRRPHERFQTRSSPGHSRPHGPANSRRHGPPPRLRHRPPHRAGQRQRSPPQPRHHLRLSRPPPAARLDFRRVGHFRQQSQGQVLFHHQCWPQTAFGGCGLLGEAFERDDARAGDAGRGGQMMLAPLRQFFQHFIALFRPTQLDQDLEAEMASHLELAIEENLRSSMSPAEARRQALIQFGGTQQAKELHRDARGLPWYDDLLRDLRYSLRMLARDPGFAIVVILTLALGVGVNTAFFSVANFIVLRPLPVRDPGQLVVLATREKDTSEIRDLSYADFLDYRKQSNMFSDMLAYRLGFDGLAADNRADRIISSYATGNYFSLLGIQSAIGRLIEAGEGWTPGADPVVVLGYAYWQRRFGGDPGVVGKQALLNGKPVTIIGVAQKHFPGVYYFLEMDTYVPIRQSASATASFWTARDERGEAGLYVLARLKPGVSLAQARLSLDVIASRLAQQYPDAERGISTEAYPERLARPQAGAANYLPVLVPLFFLLASLVLLVACINVANLALVRANERAGELALRTSLGAGPVRLLRQLLTENLLLALLGGTAGIVLGMWLASTLKIIATPVDLPMFRMDFVFDWRVFAYALAITILAGIIVGLFSTRILWRSDLISSLHEGGRALSGGRRQN